MTLVRADHSGPAGAIVVSADAGLTVEECANKVLEAGSPCGSKVQYMSYSLSPSPDAAPASAGCSCYSGAVDEAALVSAAGTHVFKIDQIAPAAIVQTPRLVKEQAYCKHYEQLGTAATVEECFAKVEAKDACKNGENTFTWDPANNGWCSCCKKGTKDALRYNIVTRDKECKIYKQTNDRTNDGATAWNGPGFTGEKEVFLEGWHDIQALRAIGNDKLAGLDVPAHLKVTLYQHHKAQGKKETFYGPYENLAVPKWQRAVSGIKVEKNEHYVERSKRSSYTKYANFCVDGNNRDIHQTRWPAGAANLGECQMECDSRA